MANQGGIRTPGPLLWIRAWKIGFLIHNGANFFQDTVSKIHVHVDTPVSGITINCPTDMATAEEDVCLVDIMAGTGMQVTITYNDGAPTNQITRTFTVAGTVKPVLSDRIKQYIFLTFQTGGCLLLHERSAETALLS